MSTGMTQIDVQAARRRRRSARLWQTPVFVLGLVCLAIVAATAPLRVNPARDFLRDLRSLRQAVQGEIRLADVADSIEPLLDQAGDHPRREAECEFLVGSYFYLIAEGDPSRHDAYARAGRHLSRALMLGVGEGDQPTLFYRMGMAQYRENRNRPQALHWVRQGLELGAAEPARGYAFLVEAYLELAPPDLKSALSASERHREYANDRDPASLGRARLLHAEILERLGRCADAVVELEQIDPAVPAPLLARIRLLQATCSEREGRWTDAADYWNELIDLGDSVSGGRGRVLYSLGVALSHIEPPDEEKIATLWREAVAAGGEAGQAAGIRLGHRLAVGADYDSAASLERWTAALGPVRTAGDFKNRHLELSQVLELYDESCRRMVEKGDFARSRTLANQLSRIAPPGFADERIAQATMRWARDLAKRAGGDEKKMSEARSRFQDAGDGFKQASLTREGDAKADLLWQSATCYVEARDFANAAIVLEKSTALTRDAASRSRGHFALAEAHLALGQKTKASEHFHKCIEFNVPPYVYRALSKLAQIEIDARKLDLAREILVQIVTRNGPDLERDILERSLYAIGKVLYDLGEADEAVVRWREAVRRFPNNPQVWAIREKIAEHAWERGKQISIPSLQGVAPERRPLAEAIFQKRRAFLQEAHDAYEALAHDLEKRHRAEKLSMDEIVLWRNSLFNAGNVKIEMGDFADALAYFHSIQLLYKGKPESLWAARSVFYCWQHLALIPGERARHQAVVLDVFRAALRDLDEIPKERDEEVFLSGPNPFSRDQWRAELRRWEAEIQHVALRVSPRGFAPE